LFMENSSNVLMTGGIISENGIDSVHSGDGGVYGGGQLTMNS